LDANGTMALHLSEGRYFRSGVYVPNPVDAQERAAAAASPDGSIKYKKAAEPGWGRYTSIAGAGDMDLDGVPDVVAVAENGDVLVFAWNSDSWGVVDLPVRVAKGLPGHRVIGVGAWSPRSVSDLVVISPTGKVSLLVG